ncbi:MAG: hypothetical protein KQI35_06255 [Bacteroidetes bacterium]|nr:hypothetical protein [Bacteroidota bacterium]
MRITLTGIILLLNLQFTHGQHDKQFIEHHSDIHRVLVEEVLQTTSYTYLHVRERDKSQWLAVPKINAQVGEEYFYQGGNVMTDFRSATLSRTFDSLLFLGGIVNANPNKSEPSGILFIEKSTSKGTKIDLEIMPLEDEISINELYANREKYADKIVRIRAQVTQFSDSIMGKNWIHMQDGSEYNGVFDLVATSEKFISVGEIAVFEGKILLNKDFGFGYFYEILMEETQIEKLQKE